ncbi:MULTISPECIES: sugar transferase [Limnospira]|uniref:Anti-sigma-factor antagonist and sugar transfersase n=1 Tax=Limnospira maxima CS-328 TaxID=513049 RepID=B5W608_LIMMA|nr:sugar transferase [Limnospira maxima]EDZ93068.1 anti-sigma-factor antagonist and sugar transfersase [Limnospira maxima CS-328]MDC0837405.1 sugar transferase [Limnoraphis robusta]QJB27522.1 STAS domain-containing protein [Limnospira fusiformis SAG 85.79]
MVSPSPEVNFPVHFQNHIAWVKIPDRLSVLEAVDFKSTCHNLVLGDQVPQAIILDFSETTFIDSSGVGALVSNLKAAKNKNVELLLKNVSPQVMAVFSLTSLDQVLTFQQDEPAPHGDNSQLPVTHPSVRSVVKRSIDIVGALVGLVITAVLSIPIVIAIRFDSPGPILFGQIRCGWMGKRFRMWKFRSMVINAEELKNTIPNQAKGQIFKNDQDPRITKVGRFLRRTSLDELPQFWNVLMGEMSLVGTRPPTPDEVERYEVPQWQRLDVKPGMTGEWQVGGRSQIKDFEDIIRLDLKYQENWSLMYDLKMIVRTIAILFKKNSGAM